MGLSVYITINLLIVFFILLLMPEEDWHMLKDDPMEACFRILIGVFAPFLSIPVLIYYLALFIRSRKEQSSTEDP